MYTITLSLIAKWYRYLSLISLDAGLPLLHSRELHAITMNRAKTACIGYDRKRLRSLSGFVSELFQFTPEIAGHSAGLLNTATVKA